MPEIGATLREARMRGRIDVSEIEAKTKIRAKYLRALENEEWSLLPGPTFVQELPAHLRAGAGAGRQGSGGGIPPALRAPQRGGARADRLARHRARARVRMPGARPSRGYVAAVGVDRGGDRAADRRPAESRWRLPGENTRPARPSHEHPRQAHGTHAKRHRRTLRQSHKRRRRRRSWRCRCGPARWCTSA